MYKNIPVNEVLIFHFDEAELFELLIGNPAANTKISSNPTITAATLIAKTMKEIGEDNSYNLSLARPITIGINPRVPAIFVAVLAKMDPVFWSELFSPLETQLQVYNRNSSTDEPQDWTLAWVITPRDNEYPVVVIDAISGSTLYSFDGIIE